MTSSDPTPTSSSTSSAPSADSSSQSRESTLVQCEDLVMDILEHRSLKTSELMDKQRRLLQVMRSDMKPELPNDPV
jgi:hypothetical protein